MSESYGGYLDGADTAWAGGVFVREAPDASSFVMHAPAELYSPAALCSPPASPLSGVYNNFHSAEVVSATSQAAAPMTPVGPPNQPTAEAEIWNQCNCRRSQCIRKYCDCFAANLRCNNSCNCQGCKNQEGEVVNLNPNPLTVMKLQSKTGQPTPRRKSKKRPRQLDLNEEQRSQINKDQLWLLFQSIPEEQQHCHLRAMHQSVPGSIQEKFKEMQHHNNKLQTSN